MSEQIDNDALPVAPQQGLPVTDETTIPGTSAPSGNDGSEKPAGSGSIEDLEAVYDIPVKITAVIGRTNIEVSDLLALDQGDILELDRKVGEAVDIFVNNRLVARGEVVIVEDSLGVTMTEIIKSDRND